MNPTKVLQPSKVAQGTRVAPARIKRTGVPIQKPTKHKAKPHPGRGQYVKAPLLRDKVTNPRWQVNALINNPGNVLAAGGLGTGVGLLVPREKVHKADRKRDAAGGALVGGGAAHFARTGADYGTKEIAERQFRPLTTKGNYGPYTNTEFKPALNKYKRTVKGDVRQKAKMFDENFPKHIPSYKARRAGVILNKKPVVAGIVAGGAATGAGVASLRRRDRVRKSAFGVEH